MADARIPTAPRTELYDASVHKPPKAVKLLVYSKYGITTVGRFVDGFHLAWGYLPQVPRSVKHRRIYG
ncbi:hypothetical protein V9W64_10625 [Neisseria leonii]|uniref:Uncharacterized protein n=1 Tax=Neisseria leonii TaxID=2995413 RepID=A0A9X4IBV3_9NEIS|nr:hypothetical protein [Neisseria sp. 51.81]MDD9328794.1 hypothetical protein [Neisseria sp. 51.81]